MLNQKKTRSTILEIWCVTANLNPLYRLSVVLVINDAKAERTCNKGVQSNLHIIMPSNGTEVGYSDKAQ